MHTLERRRCRAVLLGAVLLTAFGPRLLPGQSPYPDRVEIRRTSYGVPHILADDLGALGYGLAWAQLEDYGRRVVMNFLRGRGELGRYFGRDSIESDFVFRRSYVQAVGNYNRLHQDVRDLFEGFAAGVNRYIELHADEFAGGDPPAFTGHDVAALWTEETVLPRTERFLRAQAHRRAVGDSLRRLGDGSNAWAFAPSRTTTGNPILLRNPHISWRENYYTSYYEAHITVPSTIDFYGDFRVGFPLYFNGGFNAYLGWATTNNRPDLEEVYALDVDPERPDHYLFDGGSVAMTRVPVTVQWRNGPGLASETREFWETPLGPVVDRGEGKIYVLRSSDWDEYRKPEQFLRMMQARNLEDWQDAMRMLAHGESNHTYADRDGNIFYVWQGAVPRYPHPSGGDTAAVPAARSRDIWTELIPWDSLPQLQNPPGGYLQNANDPFHFTNLNAVVDSTRFAHLARPELGFRSQHSLSLVHGTGQVSLEDVVRLKYSYRMFAAERVKDDLIAAARDAAPGPASAGRAILEEWDNTVAPESRGGLLFETWYRRWVAADSGDARSYDERWRTLWSTPWNPAEPVTTPRGIADPDRAARLLEWAVLETRERFGALDVAWGEVHRLRRGDLDLPVGGCTGSLGCFRVLYYDDDDDGKRSVAGGDGWVFVVEFTPDGPRARSILAYGQSGRPDSPHHTDQAEMFARGEFKRVVFSEEDIRRDLVRRYRPGR